MTKTKMREMLSDLEEMERIVKMDTSSFSVIGPNPEDYPTKESEVTDFIRNRTRIWRQSWLQMPLEHLIKILREELEK